MNALLMLGLAWAVAAQYFPPLKPEGVTTLKSKFHEGVTISFKEPGICETTPGVKSYSGYVHLPVGLLEDVDGEAQNYPINTFFWFFESRKDPANAPLSIWLNGGPGGSSLMGTLQENGPCFVGDDSNSTYLNPYSWNNEVNMLFLDQPNQVGFSYDIPTNITWNLGERKDPEVADFSNGVPEQNNTFLVGTFSSLNMTHTANSTLHAAHAIWHFAQTWFEEFPYYKPKDEKISLWTESYGGRYGPAFFQFWQEQNERIANGTIAGPGTHYLHLDTLGIINGCIDADVQQLAYLDIAFNNTYGIKAINESQYNSAVEDYWKEDGCRDKVKKCRDMIKTSPAEDPNVYEICSTAREFCGERISAQFEKYPDIPRARFDIAHPKADPFPPPFLHGYLSQPHVQQALGVPVNHSSSSYAVGSAFMSTGDFVRGDFLPAIGYLLDSGVKVHTMYGDRDFACNWIGGERAVLAVEYANKDGFAEAGYTPILYGAEDGAGEFEIGGQVRQFGNFSFSRVYQAGHEVPAYQPEAAFQIFSRAMFNRDIATGAVPVTDTYSTLGPDSTFHIKNIPPPFPESVCYVLDPGTCTKDQWESVKNGSVLVKDWTVVGYGIEVEEGDEVVRDGWYEHEQKVLSGL